MTLNVNETLAKAEKDGQVYPIKVGWKIPLILCGVFVCLLIVGIPLGIWLIIFFKNSRVGLGPTSGRRESCSACSRSAGGVVARAIPVP